MKKIIAIFLVLLFLVTILPISIFAYSTGDLNNDSKINAKDISLLKKVVLGLPSTNLAQSKSDINKDGKINAVDSSLLSRVCVGNFTIEEEEERINEISINGYDLSTYVILCPENADKSMQYAARTLQSHLGNACGFYPEIVTVAQENVPVLEMRKDPTVTSEVDAGVLGNEGYHIYSTKNGIVFEGGLFSGCMHAVYDFLQDYIGYRYYFPNGWPTSNLADGAVRYVYENEKIEISNIDVTHYPAIGTRRAPRKAGYSSPALHNNTLYYDYDRAEYGLYGVNVSTCHGINQLYTWQELNTKYKVYEYEKQPCYTNQDFFEDTLDRVLKVLDSQYNAGMIPGKELCGIDISQTDCSTFCTCRNCKNIYKVDKSNSGVVVQFANKIDDEVQKRPEYKGKININIFAYYGTEKAPLVSRPNEMVSVSFCFFQNVSLPPVCNSHAIDDPNCPNNKAIADMFEEWCAITDNICVWYYPLDSTFSFCGNQFTFNTYDDIRFFRDHGVYEVYVCGSAENYNFGALNSYLQQRLMWNCDLTREGFYDMIKESLWLMYGDAGKYLWEYLCIMEEAVDRKDSCYFSYRSITPLGQYDTDYLTKQMDTLMEIRENAIKVSDDEHRESVQKITVQIIDLFCILNHDAMYTNGTAEQKTRYMEVYDEFVAECRYFNLAITWGYWNAEVTRMYITDETTIDYRNPREWMINGVRYNSTGIE